MEPHVEVTSERRTKSMQIKRITSEKLGSLKAEFYRQHVSTPTPLTFRNPPPPSDVILTSYADVMNPVASHKNYHKAEELLQPYLQIIYDWTTENDLILNPDKSTATLLTPDPAEFNTILNLGKTP